MRLKSLWRVLLNAAKNWSNDSAARLGAALSYYTIFAISPLIIIVIFVASLLFNQSSVQHSLFEQIGGLVGKKGADELQHMLKAAAPHGQGQMATIIAIVTLMLSATGLFLELQNDLNAIFGVKEKSGQGVWGFIKNRLLSFAMVVGIGFLLLVSLVVSAGLSAISKYLAALVPGMGVVGHLLNFLVSFGIITVLFSMIFKVLPDVRIRWREVWIGGAVTALLFTAGKFGLGMYLGRNTTVSAYGAAGSLVLILLWVYYSAQILFFGAELTREYANECGTRLEPKPHAEWIRHQDTAPGAPQVKPQGTRPAAAPAAARKAQLVAELREEVDAMRATAQYSKTVARS